MSAIEIRITAIASPKHKRCFKESQAYFISAFLPISAAGILTRLREMSAIKAYVKEQNMDADADRLPTIVSPLNEQGEFKISLPCTDGSDQVFLITKAGEK